jgi:ribose transport system permease protein
MSSSDTSPGSKTETKKLSDLIAYLRTTNKYLVPLLVLFLLVGGTSLVAPKILSAGALTGFLVNAAPIVMLVVGGTFPILLGSIDLSVAGIVSLAGVLVVDFTPVLGIWTVPIVLALSLVVGALQGFVQSFAQVPSFVITLGSLGVFSGLSLLLSGGAAQPMPSSDAVISFFARSTVGVPNSIITVAAVVLLLAGIMHFTRFGREVLACGAEERAAAMSGVKIILIRMSVFAISAACAALGGMLLLSMTMFSSPTLAGNILLLSVVGVVLGGTAISGGVGGLVSGVIGGVITAWLRVITVLLGLPPTSQNIVFGVVALIAVGLTTDRSKIGVIK